MQRVKSKNLFHYQLNGVVDEYAADAKKKENKQLDDIPAMKELLRRMNDPLEGDETAVEFIRAYMEVWSQTLIGYEDAIEQCIHTEFKVPKRTENDVDVPVLVHTPRSIANHKGNAAIIYAHGGGVVAGNASQIVGPLSYLARDIGVVLFNVDYRLAPETSCPKNVLDFYCAVKYIKENAEALGVDPSRLAISGDSGGGYICFAAMVMMAQKNETDLVKLAIPCVAMISDLCFTDPAAMTEAERESAVMMRKTWRCIADDFEMQNNDPLLFPAKASDAIISKMPPTIIWEMEFDLFITENVRMAHRMRREGRLLELRIQPGMDHSSWYITGTKGFTEYVNDYRLAIQHYLL